MPKSIFQISPILESSILQLLGWFDIEIAHFCNIWLNCFIFYSQDARYLPGAGATEIELANRLATYGETVPGLSQYAIKQFSQAFEAIPRALADNAGVKSTEVLSMLYAAHQEGKTNMGFDIEVRANKSSVVSHNGLYDAVRISRILRLKILTLNVGSKLHFHSVYFHRMNWFSI